MSRSSSQNPLEFATRDDFPNKFLTFLLLAFPGIVLLLHSYLSSYTRLIADDFCSFYFARRLNVLRYIWYWYKNWGGRYSAFAVDSLIENIGVKGLHYFTVTLLVIWVTVTALAFYVLLPAETGKKPSPLFTLAMGMTTVFATISISPNVQQTLYWWNGMRTYCPSLIVTTFQIGFLYWAGQNLKTRKAVLLGSIASFLIAVLNGGFNEPLTGVLLLFFAGYTALKLWSRQLRFDEPLFSFLAITVVGVALALLIMVLSPGTAIRQVFLPPPPGLLRMFEIAVGGYVAYIVNVLSSPKQVSALIAWILVSIWIGASSEKKRSNGYWILIPVLSGLLLSFASLLPSVYGTSDVPPPRTMIIPSFILIVSLFYAGLMAGKWVSATLAVSVRIRPSLMVCVGIAVVVSTLLNAKTLYDGRETYISFAQRWDQANAQILQAKSNGDASVTIAALHPWTGPGGDPTDNPKFWVTHCYSLYYEFPVFGPPLNSQ